MAGEAVIFDMDRVILDSERLVREVFLETCRVFGFEIPEGVYLMTVGINAKESRRIIEENVSPTFPWDEIRAKTKMVIDARLEGIGWPLKEGITEVISAIAESGAKIAVATSTKREQALERLDSAGVAPLFSSITGGDEVEFGKPSPDIFLLAASRLGVPPERCIVIEDSDYGVNAAYAAGIPCVLVPDLKVPIPETTRKAKGVFPSILDAKPFVLELLGK